LVRELLAAPGCPRNHPPSRLRLGGFARSLLPAARCAAVRRSRIPGVDLFSVRPPPGHPPLKTGPPPWPRQRPAGWPGPPLVVSRGGPVPVPPPVDYRVIRYHRPSRPLPLQSSPPGFRRTFTGFPVGSFQRRGPRGPRPAGWAGGASGPARGRPAVAPRLPHPPPPHSSSGLRSCRPEPRGSTRSRPPLPPRLGDPLWPSPLPEAILAALLNLRSTSQPDQAVTRRRPYRQDGFPPRVENLVGPAPGSRPLLVGPSPGNVMAGLPRGTRGRALGRAGCPA